MWRGGKRKLHTKSTLRFAVSRANPARNGLGVCPAHLNTNTPGFKPGVPVFRYAESIPKHSEALHCAGRAPIAKTYVRRGRRDRAPALRPSAVGRSRRAATAFLTPPSLPRRRASLRPVGDTSVPLQASFPTLPDCPRRRTRQPSPARTTGSGATMTQRGTPPACPFKLDGLGDTSKAMLGWFRGHMTGVESREAGESSVLLSQPQRTLPPPPDSVRRHPAHPPWPIHRPYIA